MLATVPPLEAALRSIIDASLSVGLGGALNTFCAPAPARQTGPRPLPQPKSLSLQSTGFLSR